MQMRFFNSEIQYTAISLSLTLLPGNDQPLSFNKLAKIHILTYTNNYITVSSSVKSALLLFLPILCTPTTGLYRLFFIQQFNNMEVNFFILFFPKFLFSSGVIKIYLKWKFVKSRLRENRFLDKVFGDHFSTC